MIDPKELRRGNLFYTIGRNNEIHLPIPIPVEIYTIGRFDVETLKHPGNILKDKRQEYKIVDLSPIPLTPEILASCGFKDGYFELPFGNKLCIGSSNNGEYVAYFGEQVVTLSKYYKYLHQLQNLYFALTGEELEIKL